MSHVQLFQLLKLLFGFNYWLEIQVVLQLLHFGQGFAEPFDVALTFLDHLGSGLEVNTLGGELVSVLQEVLELVELLV